MFREHQVMQVNGESDMTRKITKSATAVALLDALRGDLAMLETEYRDNFRLYDLVLLDQAKEKLVEVIRDYKEYPDVIEELR